MPRTANILHLTSPAIDPAASKKSEAEKSVSARRAKQLKVATLGGPDEWQCDAMEVFSAVPADGAGEEMRHPGLVRRTMDRRNDKGRVLRTPALVPLIFSRPGVNPHPSPRDDQTV
jgi:hypothetical protein